METLTKREIAHEILASLFRDRERIAISEAVEAGKARGVSRRTLRRAATESGVREIHNGNEPGFWERSKHK